MSVIHNNSSALQSAIQYMHASIKGISVLIEAFQHATVNYMAKATLEYTLLFYMLCIKCKTTVGEIAVLPSSSIDRFGRVTVRAPWD